MKNLYTLSIHTDHYLMGSMPNVPQHHPDLAIFCQRDSYVTTLQTSQGNIEIYTSLYIQDNWAGFYTHTFNLKEDHYLVHLHNGTSLYHLQKWFEGSLLNFNEWFTKQLTETKDEQD